MKQGIPEAATSIRREMYTSYDGENAQAIPDMISDMHIISAVRFRPNLHSKTLLIL